MPLERSVSWPGACGPMARIAVTGMLFMHRHANVVIFRIDHWGEGHSVHDSVVLSLRCESVRRESAHSAERLFRDAPLSQVPCTWRNIANAALPTLEHLKCGLQPHFLEMLSFSSPFMWYAVYVSTFSGTPAHTAETRRHRAPPASWRSAPTSCLHRGCRCGLVGPRAASTFSRFSFCTHP